MELGHRNSAQIGQLNRLFFILADLVNRVGEWLNTDWLVPISPFAPTVRGFLYIARITQFGIYWY